MTGERQFETLRVGSARETVLPWQYGHPTYTDIKAGRPITGTEAQWLLNELGRLHDLEAFVRTMTYNLVKTRDTCQKAIDVIELIP